MNGDVGLLLKAWMLLKEWIGLRISRRFERKSIEKAAVQLLDIIYSCSPTELYKYTCGIRKLCLDYWSKHGVWFPSEDFHDTIMAPLDSFRTRFGTVEPEYDEHDIEFNEALAVETDRTRRLLAGRIKRHFAIN